MALDDREAQIARAEAEVASRRLDLSASEKLGSKGMQARTQIKAAQASLAAAEAELERLRVDLTHTRIRAPFDGLVETRAVELGSLLERGDPVVELVYASVLEAVGQVPQQNAGDLALGQPVAVRLLDGRTVEGRLIYLSQVADPDTRSFRVVFYPISLARTEVGGVYVSGLPGHVRVITRGQGFVVAGEAVKPVSEDQSPS